MKYTVRALFDRSPLAIAGAYLCFGIALVPAADLVLSSAVTAIDPMGPARLLEGWLFVVLSAGVVYATAAYHCGRVDSARRELDTTNQQLQVVSRVFRHNVRNDLNVVRGYTDLLADRIDDERSLEYLETIREKTDDVVAISDKLRIVEDGHSEPSEERVDLVDVVDEAVDDVCEDDVSVAIETPSEAWIRSDGTVVYPIREVLENAIAHNDKPICRLNARIDVNGSTTCLTVSDNGPGIPDSERAVLQAEEETPLSHASSIGLWLIKWMCELQGGTVEFDTTNGGTTVRLRFRTAEPNGEGNRSRRT